jgi:hypothetical protein
MATRRAAQGVLLQFFGINIHIAVGACLFHWLVSSAAKYRKETTAQVDVSELAKQP